MSTRLKRNNQRRQQAAWKRKARRLFLESLEPRQMLAADVTIEGTSSADIIVVKDAATAGMITVESVNGTFANQTFETPTETLKIDGLGGDDTITIESLNLTTASLEVLSETISVSPNSVITSTGDIQLAASKSGTVELENLSPILVPTKTTRITIGQGVKITANDIEISAKSEDQTFTELLPAAVPDVVQTLLIDGLVDPLTDFLTLPFKVLVKKSDASILVDANVELTAAGGLTIEAEAASDATGKAASKLVSLGYVSADASAVVDIKSGVTITAEDSIGIGSIGGATASMSSETSRELGAFPANSNNLALSLAVSKADVTANTLIAGGTTITSNGSVNIVANGMQESSAEAESGLYEDGRAGLAFGLDFSNADVKADVDGTVTARVKPDMATGFEIDPTQTDPNQPGFIDTTANTIYVGPHGLSTGDTLSYGNSRGASIGILGLEGLTNGTEYFVITTDDPNKIQLAESEDEAEAGTAINLGGGATLNSKSFNIANTLDSAADTIALANPAFSGTGLNASLLGNTFADGQAVVYDAAGGIPIRGLTSGETYFVIADSNEFDLQGDSRLVGEQVIQLAETEADASAGNALDLDASGMTGTHRLSALHIIDAGEVSGIGIIATLDASNSATGNAGIERKDDSPDETTDDSSADATAFDGLFSKLTEKYKSNASKPDSGAKSSGLKTAGAMSFVKTNHVVLANVAPTAVLKSNEDLVVQAEIVEALQQNAETNIETTAGSEAAGTAISAAVSVALVDNTAKATVGAGASLDALRAIQVVSDVSYPMLARIDEFLPNSLGELVELLKEDAGGLVVGTALNGPSSLSDYLVEKLDFGSQLFNTWTRSGGSAGGTSIAGSINFLEFNNISEAVVSAGVKINQDTAFRDATANPHENNDDEQIVSVEATNNMQFFNVTGIFDFKQTPKGTGTDVKPVASGNEKGGVGGAILISLMNNTTEARIDSGVELFSGSGGGANVNAEEAILNFNFSQAGASAGEYGIGGTVAYVEQDSYTHARLSGGAKVTGGKRANETDAEGSPVLVNANSLETNINWAGSVAKARNLGFGITVAINDIDRDTQAIIGNVDPSIDPSIDADAAAAPSTTTDINATGDVNVQAGNDGALWAFTYAASIAGGNPPTSARTGTAPNGSTSDGKKPKYGVGISANVSINSVDDDVRAYIHDSGTIVAPNIAVASANDTELYVLAAAASVLLPSQTTGVGSGSSSTSASIAGSFSKNELTGTTSSFIKGLNQAAAKKLLITPVELVSVTAERSGTIKAITAGLGVSVNRPGNSIVVAGSVSLNEIDHSTLAKISGVQDDSNPANPDAGATAYKVVVNAKDDSSIFSLAGSLSLGLGGGNLGVGFSYASNTIKSDTDAGLDQVNLLRVDQQTISATNQTDIRAITISGSLAAGTGNQIALSGSVSNSTIESGASAFIKNSTVIAAGAASVISTDASSINTDGGGVAIAAGKAKEGSSGGSGGIGISLAFNKVTNNTLAYIDGSTLDAASVRVQAESKSARSKSFDFSSVNAANDSITLNDHGLATGDSLTYQSLGAVGVAAGIAIGGLRTRRRYFVIRVDDNTIKLAESRRDANDFKAIDLSNTAGTSHRLTLSKPTIEALSLAGAGGGAVGGGTTGAFAAAGAGAENTVKNRVEAYMINSGETKRIEARAGDVVLKATDSAIIDVDVIGASAGIGISNGGNGGALTVGVSIARNEIDNRVQAYVDKSTVVASGNFEATVDQQAKISALAVAASLAIGASSSNALSLSGGGAEASNVILTKANAYAKDSTLSAVNVDVTNTNSSQIDSKVIAASLSVGLGSSNAGAASIGAARARNFIGYKLDGTVLAAESQAYVMNSSINASGDLTVRSIADQDINATVIAGSAAVSAAGSNALGLSGAGVDVNNKIRVLSNAFIDGDGATGIAANTITVSADDSSSISAVGVGASLAVAAAGTGAAALSIGVSLAKNEVDNDVLAYIRDADQTVARTGDVDVSAASRGKKLFDLDTTGPQLVTSEELDDLATTVEDVKETSADEQAQDISNDAAIFAKLRTQFVSKGESVSSNLKLTGLDDGASWSLVDANDNLAYLIKKQPDGRLEVSYTTIKAIGVAASAAAGFGGTGGVALSGAGADAKNVISTDTNAFIENSSITAGGAVDLDAASSQSMISTIIAASVALAGGGTGGVGASIGAALAENFIGFDQAGGTDANKAAEVRAYVVDSSINAGGELSQTAVADQGIVAVVFAGSAAIAGGGTGALGLAGSGVNAKNKIGARVEASISGDGAGGINADSVSLVARDTSNIKADAGAVSLAASFAGVGAVSLSIGVALASNEISNQVAAFIDSVDTGITTRTGDVVLNAAEDATIRSRTAAAAASIAISGTGGLALAGAGAEASNVILGGVNAFITDSKVTSADEILVHAQNRSVINAQVISAAASIGVGGVAGGAVSIGASLANNSIGFGSSGTKTPLQVRAYVEDSTLIAQNAIEIGALAQSQIKATTFAGSVAIAGGLAAAAGAGSGVNTTNKIANDVAAFVRGPQSDVTGSAISLEAADRSDITANANAASIAAAIGIGGAVSIAVTLAQNVIENDVRAFHEGGTLTARTGDVIINAVSVPTISSTGRAGGVAAGVGVGAAAGLNVKNTIGGTTSAAVQSGNVTASSGQLQVMSQSIAIGNVAGSGLAAALGIGAAVGAVLTESTANGTTESIVGGTINVDRLTVTANGLAESGASSTAVSGGIVGVGVNKAGSSVTPTVRASVLERANITVAGDATVSAISSAVANAKSMGVTVGAYNVGLSNADLTLKPTVHATIGDRASLLADGKLSITSQLLKNEGNVVTTASGGGLAGASGALSKQTVVADVQTVVGRAAMLAGSTGLDVLSSSLVKLVDESKVEIGGGVSLQKAETKETINTTAHTMIGGASQLHSARGTVNVDATNQADVKSESKTRFYGLGSGAIANATTRITGIAGAELAETVLGAGSLLSGPRVDVGASVSTIKVDSDADGQQFSAGGVVHTISVVDVAGTAAVEHQTGSRINAGTANILAEQGVIDINGLGDQSKGFGLAPVHDGNVINDVSLFAEVRVGADAEVAANTIDIKAKGATGNVINDKNNDAVGIPVSKIDVGANVNTGATVHVAGQLLPGSNFANLVIDDGGTVLFNQGFDGPNLATGTTITGANATINGLQPAEAARLTIRAERSQLNVTTNEDVIALGTNEEDFRNTQAQTVTIESAASYAVPDRFASVTIDNRSGKHLDINGIDVLLTGTTVTPVISPAATLTDSGVKKLSGAIIELKNNSETATANIFLDGAINNPTGMTKIHTTSGSILDREAGATSRINTATLDLSAGLNLGETAAPIQADVSQETGATSASTLKAVAGGSTNLALAATTPVQALDALGIEGQTGNVSVDFAGKPVSVSGPIVASDSGTITLSNVAALSDSYSTGTDISGGSLSIQTSTGDVSTLANPFETSLSNVEIATTAGIFLDNDKALTIGGISPLVGLSAGTAIRVITNTSLAVNENLQATSDIRLTVRDEVDPTANQILLGDNVAITSTGGNLALLAGDPSPLKAGQKLSANGGIGEVVIALDWGNADPGVANAFTLPNKSADVFAAATLRVLGNRDDDTLTIPELFMPKGAAAASRVIFEAGAGADAVEVNLLETPSEQTRLQNLDVETIDFRHVSTAAVPWQLDTESSTQTIGLFEGAARQFNVAHLSSGANRIVENAHTVDARFESLDVDYQFGSGLDTLTVLAMRHPATLKMGGGNDVVTVGGNRIVNTTQVPVDPGKILKQLDIDAGGGTDTFVLVEPRTGDNVVPVGRIGSRDAQTGLINNYSSPAFPASDREITFSAFEAVTVNLGEVANVFTIEDTIVSTTINAGGNDDAINVRKLSAPTTVNLEDGDDTINIQGGGGNFLTINGGTSEKSLQLPEGGDRLRFGSTRNFDRNSVDLANSDAITLFGAGWEPGQQLLFTTDGIAPGGLTSGQIYYAVPSGNLLRLAETRDLALATPPTTIALSSGGLGEHQLTLAVDGQPQWPTTIGSLTGTNETPVLSYTQPAAETMFTVNQATNTLTTTSNHGLSNGQQVAVYSSDDLPSGLSSVRFYFVINATATSLKLASTSGGAEVDITAVGTGEHFVVPVNVATFTEIEKMNVALGLGDDRFIIDNAIDSLSIEMQGGPGNDEFALYNVPGENTIIRGGSGDDDRITVVSLGNPEPDQFKSLTVSAGIETLVVDNGTNTNAIDWIISQGSLHFADGGASITNVDTTNSSLAFTQAEFAASRVTATDLSDGDRVLVTSTGELPKHSVQGPVNPNDGVLEVQLDGGQFYTVKMVGGNNFQLLLSPTDTTPLTLTSAGTGDVSFRRVAKYVSVEGADRSELRAGGNQVDTLSVVTPLNATVDVAANNLRIIEGARVLDHEDQLSKANFSLGVVDGLRGAKSVVTVKNDLTRPFVFAAGSTDLDASGNAGKIAMFVRELDTSVTPNISRLNYVGALDRQAGVPIGVNQLELTPDGRYLFASASARLLTTKSHPPPMASPS